MTAKGSHVCGHVRGAPRNGALGHKAYDGHRRLGRYAVDLTFDVEIEHDVAHHGDTDRKEAVERHLA